jgi:hypothetical protein
MINYFEPAATAEEEIIRRIKGNYRRRFVSRAMRDEGSDSIPDLWKNHEFSEVLKKLAGATKSSVPRRGRPARLGRW